MGHEAEDEARTAESDLGQAEVIESAGMQNSVAVAGPGALLMVPLCLGDLLWGWVFRR